MSSGGTKARTSRRRRSACASAASAPRRCRVGNCGAPGVGPPRRGARGSAARGSRRCNPRPALHTLAVTGRRARVAARNAAAVRDPEGRELLRHELDGKITLDPPVASCLRSNASEGPPVERDGRGHVVPFDRTGGPFDSYRLRSHASSIFGLGLAERCSTAGSSSRPRTWATRFFIGPAIPRRGGRQPQRSPSRSPCLT